MRRATACLDLHPGDAPDRTPGPMPYSKVEEFLAVAALCCMGRFVRGVRTGWAGGPPLQGVPTMPFETNADRRHHFAKQRHRVTNRAECGAGSAFIRRCTALFPCRRIATRKTARSSAGSTTPAMTQANQSRPRRGKQISTESRFIRRFITASTREISTPTKRPRSGKFFMTRYH
jgi:hypothetical protein